MWTEASPRAGRVHPKVATRSKHTALRYIAALPAASGPHWAAVFRRAFVKTAPANFYAYDAADKSNALSEKNDLSEKTASLNTFALGLAYRDSSFEAAVHSEAERTGSNSVLSEAIKPVEDDGITIQVSDTRRGFTSSMRMASRVQRGDGQQVLTIHVEDKEEKDASFSSENHALLGEVRMEAASTEPE